VLRKALNTKVSTLGAAQTEGEPFVRVLAPADPWLQESKGDMRSRAQHFKGKSPAISVAKEDRCNVLRVLAAFHGSRKEAVLGLQAFYRFDESEVLVANGELADTDAAPPWPSDYNHAHHDICKGQDSVADHMAALHDSDPGRVNVVDEADVLACIAALLGEPDVGKKFEKNARRRFRRMFEEERGLWVQVASREKTLLADAEIQKAFRKMYQDKSVGRPAWAALLDELGVPTSDREMLRH
jgi:hypothetical protein